MREPTEKEIEELKAKVAPRDLHQIEIEADDELSALLVSTPTKVEWMKFVHDLGASDDIARQVLAHENFILAVTKWPAREEVKGYLERYPAICTQITGQIGALVGAGAKVRAKKL